MSQLIHESGVSRSFNDSITVAVEIPVFLTNGDIDYYRQRGFDLGFESNIITGHIDFLQIPNGHIHLLDYKPEARKETHAHVQLTIYALAIARRTVCRYNSSCAGGLMRRTILKVSGN